MESRIELEPRVPRRCAIVAAAALVFLAAAPGGAQVAATATAEDSIRSLHTALVAAASEPDVDARYRALEPVVQATHDLPYIAEFALRRQWPSLDTEARRRYVEAFERLSVMTYASRFAGIGEETLRITGVDAGNGQRAEVTATVARANGEPVTLEYLLHERDGAWRIINIVADGVSDLALKRAEYQSVLAGATIDDVIAELDAQTSKLRASE